MTELHEVSYTIEKFANPYLRCIICDKPVEGKIYKPNHAMDGKNWPCLHMGVDSVCQSWGPVDGCSCEKPHDGVWMIYGYDTMPYPLYLARDEEDANKYMACLGFTTFKKFWLFGEEFGTR